MARQTKQIASAPRLWQVMLALYWLTLLISTHLPPTAPLVPGSGIDKAVHFAAFALLALLFATTWQRSSGRLIGHHLRVAWIVLALFAAADEGTQAFVGRDASLTDWLADAAGAAFGLALFAWLNKRFSRRGNVRL